MEPPAEVGTRVERFTRGTDLGWVANLLADRRDEILGRWLEVTSKQTFHQGRSPLAIGDDIPRLFDALVRLLGRAAPREVDPEPPLGDPAVLEAAQAHAHTRFQQGLHAAQVVTEFRLLRQEIGRALRLHLTEAAPTGDVVGAELLVHDALDGAIALALAAMASHVDEVRDELLAGTVHDVQQPLTAIKGNLQLALRGLGRLGADAQGVREAVDRAHAETDRMSDLVATLSDASRLVLGRLEPRLAEVDLRALVADTVARCGEIAAGRIRVTAPPRQSLTGRWDAAMLERVVGNLVSNALKYSPPDTAVEIVCGRGTDDVRLAVHDHGMGLTENELRRLFHRYSRGQRAIESGVPGLGLGLYLSRGIVEAHGGRIWAESAGRDLGTSIYLVLPSTPRPATD